MTDIGERDSGLPKLARFEVVRRIGDGGMGIVYEAIDRERGTRVALKTLHRFDAETLLHLKQEFRALQDIQHPNLVALGELMRDGDTWFFTMEMVEGVDLRSYLGGARAAETDRTEEITVASHSRTNDPPVSGERPRATFPSAPAPPDAEEHDGHLHDEGSVSPKDTRLRLCFAQLAKALRALHAAGKVHRDVKPLNVLVTKDGRVVLFDFGLILDAAGPQPKDSVVGTARYMAPEQAANRGIGAPADWYSFGVVLYESLTGRSLFEGDRARVLERKLLEDPPRASFAAPNVAPDLDELCARLLSREPSQRPSGAEILRCLLAPLGLAEDPRDPPSSPAPALRPPFVGRDAERTALRKAFDRALSRRAVAVVVSGESGVGKSALVQRFVRDLERARGRPSDRPMPPAANMSEAPPRNVLVLAGRCYEREVVPYKAFDGVMDALCRHLSPLAEEEVAALLPSHASLLAQVFPVLRRLARFELAATQRRSRHDLGAHESRARLFETVREMFAKLGARCALVVVIDDLHWADADSLALLHELLRPPNPPRLLLVATARAAALSATSGDERGAPFGLPGDVVTLPVGRLATAESLELARALLGEGAPDSTALAAEIAAEAGGHPLFVDELVRHALDGTAAATRRGLPLDGSAANTARRGLQLDAALVARAARLDPRDRHVLEMLAVAGVSLAPETAMRAAELDLDSFARSVSALRAAHLARTGGKGGVETYHDRVREAVVAQLDDGARRAWNQRLALALEAETGRDPDAVATRWIDAGAPSRAAPFATEAAHKAFEALAYNRAANLYARAIGLVDAAGASAEDAEVTRRALRVRLGEALACAGRGSEAASAFLAAAQGAKGEKATDLRRRAAEELLIAGNVEPGMAMLSEVHAELGLWTPTGTWSALFLLIFYRAVVAVRGLRFVVRPAEEIPREALARTDACWGMARSLSFIDPILSAYFQTRMLLLALRWGEPYRLGYALSLEAMWIAVRGTRTRAAATALLARADEVTRQSAEPQAAALTLGASGFTALVQGRLREAVVQTDGAQAMLGALAPGLFWETRSLESTGIWALSAMGNLSELAPRVDRALRAALDRGDVATSTVMRTGTMNLLWLRTGDVAGARAEVDDAMRQWTRRAYHNQHWWASVALAQADLYEGKGRDAWTRIARDWPRARRALVFSAELVHFDARHIRARTAILAARETNGAEREKFLRYAGRDVRWLERSGPSYAPAWVHALSAYIAAVRGDREAAAKGLARALPGFDAAPVYLWAAAARFQLAGLIGGAEGEALRARAIASMSEHGAADVERMVAVFAPGFERSR